jgi:ribosomal protein S27E
VLFYYFDSFLSEYEERFEKEYGFLRTIVKEIVKRYLDCGNPRCGFAKIRCPGCGEEQLLMFSCRTRGFCPSCHANRIEEWGEWMRETLLLDVPHHQVVFTIPRMLRIFFKYKSRLLGELCQVAVQAFLKYFQAITVTELRPGDNGNHQKIFGFLCSTPRSPPVHARGAQFTVADVLSRLEILLVELVKVGAVSIS